MRIQVQLQESLFRRLFCAGEKLSSDTQALQVLQNSLAFAAISGSTMNRPNGLVAFVFLLSSWMKACEMMLLVCQITGPEGRVKPLLLLGLKASPSHNMIGTDQESKFHPGLGMVLLPPHPWHPGDFKA